MNETDFLGLLLRLSYRVFETNALFREHLIISKATVRWKLKFKLPTKNINIISWFKGIFSIEFLVQH